MNRKTLLFIGIIFIAVLLIFLVFVIVLGNMTIVDKDGMINTREHELIGVRYSCSGGMEGGYHYISLLKEDDGELWYSSEIKTTNGAEETTLHFKVQPSDLDKIRTICREKHALILGELKKSDLILLDAPVTTVTFLLEDEMITISDDDELPESSYGIIGSVYSVLMEMIPEQN